jgi:hypothetical protein
MPRPSGKIPTVTVFSVIPKTMAIRFQWIAHAARGPDVSEGDGAARFPFPLNPKRRLCLLRPEVRPITTMMDLAVP